MSPYIVWADMGGKFCTCFCFGYSLTFFKLNSIYTAYLLNFISV